MATSQDGTLSCGLDRPSLPNITTAIHEAREQDFDFIIAPLAHPRQRRTFSRGQCTRPGAFTRSDLVLSSDEWTSLIVGKVSPWIDVDAALPSERRRAEDALHQELQWAFHLAVPAVMVPLCGPAVANLASVVGAYMLASHAPTFWIRVPLYAPAASLAAAHGADGDGDGDDSSAASASSDPWEWYNRFRSLCPATGKLAVALELTADLPSAAAVARWCAEPIKAVIVPTSIFLCNSNGFPVLSKAHQAVVRKLMQYKCQFVVSGNPKYSHGARTFSRYLQHLFKKQSASNSALQDIAAGFEDYLQAPLQPLMDNLESQTYETFEKDPVKYAQYKEAVYRALLDRVPDADKDRVTTVVMVVGAGRGPLVQASLEAAEKAGRKIHAYAIEKNPNAIVTLHSRNAEQWGNRVRIVAHDMRTWEAPEQADILVSELLGSFGDNELSPECLDGAQKFLKPDGISIPASYTSYLAPVAAPKLHTDISTSEDSSKQLETPFVVMLHTANLMGKIEPLFVFEHPNPACGTADGPDNTRYGMASFTVPEAGEMHGFAGYFESVLYKDVMISIHPDTHSPGMFSWFPIYFPIKNPVYVPEGARVEAHFWRRVSATHVWYEWALTSPVNTKIHNHHGQAYKIGL